MSNCIYSEIRDFSLCNHEESLGALHDIYLDDNSFSVSWFVFETGAWFSSNKILLDTSQVLGVDLHAGAIHTALERDQIENAESPEAHPTVSEQTDDDAPYRINNNFPLYAAGYAGMALPSMMLNVRFPRDEAESGEKSSENVLKDQHLRSANEVTGYSVMLDDGELGNIQDLIIDYEKWTISFVVVDTGNWLPGKPVAIEPTQIESINWPDRTVNIRKTKRSLKDSKGLNTVENLKHSSVAQSLEYYRIPF